jgi:hypothetical protein
MKFDDYGPATDHPHDPRNSQSEEDELLESTLTALENALHFVNKAIKVLNKEHYPDIEVTMAMDAAIAELGGVVPNRGIK